LSSFQRLVLAAARRARGRPVRLAYAAAAAGLVLALASGPGAPVAEAHGLVGRQDLPIPAWLFAWAAALVLVLSFVALAVLWPMPRLEEYMWRALPAGAGRLLASRALEVVGAALGAFLLGVVVWSGLFGDQVPTANFAPTWVYVIFWLGLVPASVLLGDVFRFVNPWRAVARAVAWAASKLIRGPMPAPLAYPAALGHWPAAAGLLAFAWLELVSPSGDVPRVIALAVLAYSSVTWIAMATYGIDPWLDRGEAFSVYFNLYSRLSVWERRGREVGLRPPLAGLAQLEPGPGTVALLAVMIGSVTFDGASAGRTWQNLVPPLQRAFEALGFARGSAVPLAYALGLLGCVALAYGFYRLGIAGMQTVARGEPGSRLANAFVHSLVPIALVYAAAHYVSLLVLQGQAIAYLASDPLGAGWDVFGTASREVDYALVGAETFWYVQVALVVLGHVAALVLAHDRALALFERAQVAVRSQYWMLAVMVGFTSLALWLLAEANRG
jgi:hypothetical protein